MLQSITDVLIFVGKVFDETGVVEKNVGNLDAPLPTQYVFWNFDAVIDNKFISSYSRSLFAILKRKIQ